MLNMTNRPMLKRMRTTGLLVTLIGCLSMIGVLMLGTMLFNLAPTVHAAVVSELTLELAEPKVKHQFIVQGDHAQFDVDLTLPDGTVLSHTDIDPEQQLYLGLENEKIWVLLEAPAGTYTFQISSEISEGSYRVRDKDAIEMPRTDWLHPVAQAVTITSSSDRIPLAWQASNSASSNDRISIYLQRQGTSLKREVSQYALSAEEVELRMPSYVTDGEYILTAEADNGTFERQVIDPQVVIHVQRGAEALRPELIGQSIERGAWTVDLQVPDRGWDRLYAEIIPPDHDGTEPMIVQAERNELFEMEAADGTRYWRWAVTELTEDGEYAGQLYLVDDELAVGPAVELDPIQYRFIEASDHQVEWSIDEERTGLRYMDVTVTAAVDSELVLRTTDHIVAQYTVLAADGLVALQIGLREGEHLYELDIIDRYGNVNTYAKRLFVDHTPPRLEMIQPLPTHAKIPDNRVSGFVEVGSLLQIDDREIEVAADGYFQHEGVRGGFTIRAIDESSNETHYHWEPKSSTGFVWWPIFVIVGLVSVTVGIIWWLRRTRTRA